MSPIWQHLGRCRGLRVRVARNDATRSYALSGFVARFHGSVLSHIDASRVRDGAVATTDYEENDDIPTAPSEKVQKIVEDIAGLTLVEVADMSALLKKKLRIQNVPVMPMGMNVMPDMWYEAPIPPQLASRRGPGIFPFEKEELEPGHLLRSRKPPLDLGQQRDMPGTTEMKTAANEAAVPLRSEVLATLQMKERKVSFKLPSTSDEGEDDDEDYESEEDDEFVDDDEEEVPAPVGKKGISMEWAKPVGKNKVAAAPPMQVQAPKVAVGKKKSTEPEKPMPVMKKKNGKFTSSVEVEEPEPELVPKKKSGKAAPAKEMKDPEPVGKKKNVKNRVAPVVESEPDPESEVESELESEPEPELEPEPAQFGKARPRLKSNGRFVSAAEYVESEVNPVPLNSVRASPASAPAKKGNPVPMNVRVSPASAPAKKGTKELTASVASMKLRKSGALPVMKEVPEPVVASKGRPVAKQEAPALPATKKTVAVTQSGKTASKSKR